jgi:capsule polysaccharide export protein KpsE/RkpR
LDAVGARTERRIWKILFILIYFSFAPLDLFVSTGSFHVL